MWGGEATSPFLVCAMLITPPPPASLNDEKAKEPEVRPGIGNCVCVSSCLGHNVQLFDIYSDTSGRAYLGQG